MDLVSDIGTLAKVLPNILRSRIHVKNSTGNFVDTWNNTVELNRDRIALQMNSRSLSFNDIQIHSNQFAHAFLLSGIRPKDVVCVMLENIPEFVIICLALSKIGAVGALINFNLREKALFHCIKIVNPVAIIFQDHFAVFIKQIVHNIKTDFPAIKFFSFDESSTKNSYSFVDIALSPQYIREFSNQVTDPKLRSTTNFTSPYLYIYTSGTTGLPKAATVTHLKAFSASTLFPDMLNVVKEDRVFCCLPLYHSSAFLISWGFAIHHGATLILSQKFSTSNFWKDVVNSEATVISYIGELARYLLNAYPTDESFKELKLKSKVRLAIGNGLRPDIWQLFKDRFAIKTIGEFYSATEANVALFNLQTGADGVGAIGKMGPISERAMGLKIVKLDLVTEELVRGKNGFCVICVDGEVGEMIAPVDASRHFAGYVGNKKASEKKIITDVFAKGDQYFRSGDLLKRIGGYYYFIDRIGDTFRWKGENVSTMEVAEAISLYPGIAEANVYGIQLPGVDGSCGMVSVVPQANFDIGGLYSFLKEKLPSYAIPIFVRIQAGMTVTGTFKHQKVDLKKQGCDPSNDKVFWLKNGGYVLFSRPEFLNLMAGKL